MLLIITTNTEYPDNSLLPRERGLANSPVRLSIPPLPPCKPCRRTYLKTWPKLKIESLPLRRFHLKGKIAELQKQMTWLQQDLFCRPTSSTSAHRSVDATSVLQPTPPPPAGCPSSETVPSPQRCQEGCWLFSDRRHWLPEKKPVSIDNYATVMNISIIDFPTLEMKFPQSFTDNLVLKRVSLFQAAPRVSWHHLRWPLPPVCSQSSSRLNCLHLWSSTRHTSKILCNLRHCP